MPRARFTRGATIIADRRPATKYRQAQLPALRGGSSAHDLSTAANAIVVRGLNADPIAGTEALGNAGGGTVATYVGEIPLYIDLKPFDMERVEVLLGPQGTLYGAGTLGGAIRYIPMRPQFDALSVDLRAQGYSLAHSESLGGNGGFTVNVPLGDSLALRGSLMYWDDPGFIDYNYVVRESGVSDPEPDFSNPADVSANLRRVEDADFEKTLAGRIGLRWQPTEAIDANLTYYYQNQEVGGRTQSHQVAFGTGPYEAAHRYEEPNERENQLAALEIAADLGFAELTSATGFSKYEEFGQRDQTDLLITLEYSYEAFPTFSAYTREDQEEETFNQEFRLVSNSEGMINWIAGVFYNQFESDAVSQEFTPGYSQYLIDAGVPGLLRPDALEYYSQDLVELQELAAYGELTFQFTPKWQVTVGTRWYKYELDTRSDADFPLAETTFGGRTPVNAVVLEFEQGGQKDDGFLFKFNTSYQFTDDIMAYLTVSEGYRIGNSNGVALCDGTLNTQGACATPREFQYFPDSTTNYEIGWRTQFLDRRVTLNGAVFYIDWEDPQLTSATVTGAIPITINGEGATTYGFELQLDTQLTDQLRVGASYSYVKAELSEDSSNLIRTISPPGFGETFEDGLKGDRLPGSPEQQGSLFATYTIPVGGMNLDINYGLNAIGDVLTRTGGRGGGEELGGFTLHSASLVLNATDWSIALYGKNILDKYAETGARSTTRNVQTVADENGDPVRVRSYAKDIARPREIGLRFTYDFDL